MAQRKTSYHDVNVWMDEKEHIHIAIPDVPGFHTTVNNNPESKRGHPNLYMKLVRALRQDNAVFPAGFSHTEEPAEDEDPSINRAL